MTTSTADAWFALRVKSNRERVTSQALVGKGYEVFLPEWRRPGSRGESPLFPGYLFCRFDLHNRLPVLSLPGVVHIVGLGRTPIAVDEGELESLKIVVNSELPVTAEPVHVVGQPVRIEKGPLAGAEGVVVGVRPHRLVVTLSLLRRYVSVEVDRDWVGSAEMPFVPTPPGARQPDAPEAVSRSRES